MSVADHWVALIALASITGLASGRITTVLTKGWSRPARVFLAAMAGLVVMIAIGILVGIPLKW